MSRGGSRPGAGRPPKGLRYAQQAAAAEGAIAAALPELVEILLGAARKGDAASARYLVDRLLGRAPTQAYVPADDMRIPKDDPGIVAERQAERARGEARANDAQSEFAALMRKLGGGLPEAVPTAAATASSGLALTRPAPMSSEERAGRRKAIRDALAGPLDDDTREALEDELREMAQQSLVLQGGAR